MKVTLWGTRGSLPNAGPETVRYGGNTSCVEVRGNEGTMLVLDAGTGIRRLGGSLNGGVPRVDILLTHLHMDHIQGLGFFGPLYQAGAEVHIWGPPSATLDLRGRLGRYLSPPLFPVRIRDLPSMLEIHDVHTGRFEIGEFRVIADLVCHPGPTFGYRISENGSALAYLPDHEPALVGGSAGREPQWTSGYDLAANSDLLLHDSQYGTAEYADHIGWGHSTIAQSIEFATAVGAQRLVTFHHDPAHDDPTLDCLLAEARGECRSSAVDVIAGTEGATFDV